MKPKYYIATSIAYASAKPHIGNTYEIVLADSIARYKRSRGFDVYFQTGTDEHGEKIEQKAISAGISPKEYVDNISREIKNIWDTMNTSYDKFVRTTDEHHKKVVQHIFEYLYQKGDIYLGQYNGMYCTPCESFWTESQLVDGKCPDCGRDVEPRCEEAYFFKMSKYQDKLIEYIETHPEFIQPVSRKNEMINNFLRPGLQDLCVSRTTFDWGIRVPFNDKHVVYVWIDALTNYITNIGYDVNNESEEFKKWWPCDLHLIGKDIIRFHTIYWPILLMALDLPLPKQVFGHPWLLMNNDKMSKSKGNILYADDLVNFFGVDAIRYYLLHEIPFQNDGTISYELIIERINSDLANILGNLVNRTISMSQKYFDGEITNKNINDILDEEFIEPIKNLPSEVDKAMDKLEIGNAIDKIFDVLRKSNKYIDDTTPWSLAKDDSKKDRLETVLYNLLESIKVCGSELMPFLPDTAGEILRQINTELSNKFETSNKYNVLQPEPIFMRIDVAKKLEEINAKRS
uniref:methionine--tRNA ligase n=1 Tax=Candidatus Ventrenecus sp. TaxID=3085654 RepID=UPI003FEDE1D0